jgi:ElaB/YqjD/DUF883 family membrane-anchored ribosome-binding protein
MAEQKSKEKELKEAIAKEKEAIVDTYDEILNKFKAEREKLQKEVGREIESARKYVKNNPDTGVGIALAGGIIAGIIIGKILNR